jgi:hypothetical protein
MKEYFSFIIVVLLALLIGCSNRLVFNPNSPYSYMEIPTYPNIISVNPGNGATDVSTTTPVTVVFSKDLDQATVGMSTFIVADSDYVPVDGTFSFPDTRTAVFTPAMPLVNLAEYNVLLTTEIMDADGNGLSSEKMWYFTTISFGTVPDPVFTPVSGTYEGPQPVTITCLDPEATIRYTSDGTEPTPSTGSVYTAPFPVTSNTLYPIKAIAYRTGFDNSSISSACYIIQAFTPMIDPPPGIYSIDPLVTLSTQTLDAIILYTLDLSDPATSLSAFTYVEPFGVIGPGTVTIMAVALSPDLILMANSPALTANYIINYEEVAPPVFTPPPGTYTTDLTVSLASATTGALIRYTTDGSDPVASGIEGGTLVNVDITETTTINAYAYDTMGLLSDSIVTTGLYIIAPTIFDMVPNKGPNNAPISITITGAHFRDGVTVQLTRNIQPPIDSEGPPTLVNSSTIICTFNITSQQKGKWTLVVTNPDSGTALKNEFRIY